MTIKRVRYAKIERLVGGVLSNAGVEKPAVDVKRLIHDRNIEIRFGHLGDISGLIARRDGCTIIGVNNDQTATRQRFTLAHEFGHYLLHEGISSHADNTFRINYRDGKSSKASDVDEMEANFFAACLLMPKTFLDNERAYYDVDNDDLVSRLADKFEVSQHAMSLRLSNVYRRHTPF